MIEKKPTRNVKGEIVFTDKDGQEIKITGVSADMLSHPEKIRKLMEHLGLPEGTKAKIIHITEDVIVR